MDKLIIRKSRKGKIEKLKMNTEPCPHDDTIRKLINDKMHYDGFCYLCDMTQPAKKSPSRRYDADAVDEKKRNQSKRARGTSRFGKLKGV